MADSLGFIGLGHMGGPIAARMLDAGFALTVYDINEAAMAPLVANGARPAGSAAEVASAAETVFVSLPTPAVVQAVALGPHGAVLGNRLRTFVDLSTTGPKVARAVAEGFAANGTVAIEAPVSGGPAGAAAGTLAIMVSGPSASVDSLRAAFASFGRVMYLGERPGAAQTMKLVNNLLSACAIAITAEGMAMGVKAGLDPAEMIEVLNISSGRNSATADKWPRAVLPRTFDFGFPAELSLKDVRLCLDEAEALGVPMVVGSAVRQMLAITRGMYGPGADFTSLAKVVETWAGLDEAGADPQGQS